LVMDRKGTGKPLAYRLNQAQKKSWISSFDFNLLNLSSRFRGQIDTGL
jgi:hypothetical protein